MRAEWSKTGAASALTPSITRLGAVAKPRWRIFASSSARAVDFPGALACLREVARVCSMAEPDAECQPHLAVRADLELEARAGPGAELDHRVALDEVEHHNLVLHHAAHGGRLPREVAQRDQLVATGAHDVEAPARRFAEHHQLDADLVACRYAGPDGRSPAAPVPADAGRPSPWRRKTPWRSRPASRGGCDGPDFRESATPDRACRSRRCAARRDACAIGCCRSVWCALPSCPVSHNETMF